MNSLPDEVLIQLNKWLTHSEERESTKRDQWGNWEHQFSQLNYQIPFADLLVLKHINYVPGRIWPDNKNFAVCVTHDIDAITSTNNPKIAQRWSLKKWKEKELNHLIFFKSYLKSTLQRILKKTKNDILWINEKWIDFELENSVRSTIFFMVRPDNRNLSKYDNDYLFSDKFKYKGKMVTVSDYCKLLADQNFEIGLHGSYNTYNNLPLLLLQKKKLEQVIKKPIISTRQHYLHYEINTTPIIQEDAEIKIDSTLGYNQALGFRAGTCFPYRLTNKQGNLLNIVEIPQILMDGAIFQENSLNLNKDEGLKKSIEIMNTVEKVGGCLTLNFHPEHFSNDDYFSLFRNIILEAKKRNAYFGTLAEINDIV